MDNEFGIQDPQNLGMEDVPLDTYATPDAIDDSMVQDLAEKNKQLFARAKKAEERIKEYKEKEKIVVEKPVVESSTPQVTDEIETVLNLRSQNYSDAEILTLRKYAKKMNTPIAEILNDPFIKSGIEREREKSKVEQSTPSPSNRSVIVDNKNWAEMTPAERESNFSKVRDNFKGGNRSSE